MLAVRCCVVMRVLPPSRQHGREDDKADDQEQEQRREDGDKYLVEIHLPEGTDRTVPGVKSSLRGDFDKQVATRVSFCKAAGQSLAANEIRNWSEYMSRRLKLALGAVLGVASLTLGGAGAAGATTAADPRADISADDELRASLLSNDVPAAQVDELAAKMLSGETLDVYDDAVAPMSSVRGRRSGSGIVDTLATAPGIEC